MIKKTGSLLEHWHLVHLFSIKENQEEHKEVLELIKHNQFDRNPANFYKSFLKVKHPKMVTPYGEEDFMKMKTYKVKGYDIGFALKPFNDKGYAEIVAVHNSEPEIHGVGPALVDKAIEYGGKYLDHYDGFLTGLYTKGGFVEYDREPFNPEYDEDGSFRELYGEPDIIYRHHKSVASPKK